MFVEDFKVVWFVDGFNLIFCLELVLVGFRFRVSSVGSAESTSKPKP